MLGRIGLIVLVPMLLGVTISSPGTVTTVVNPNLFTKPRGDNHLHGIVRDPISGDIYVGDWNALSVGNTPFFGPFVENRDAIRRINQLQEVSVLAFAISPNAMTYSTGNRQLYVVVGSVACNVGGNRAPAPTLNGIVSIDPATGKVNVLAGGQPGLRNGSSSEARFSEPAGIGYDAGSGALFVSESCQNRIRMVDPQGTVATLAGSGAQGNADGNQLQATFNHPRGIAYCENEHTLYVADTGNNEIRAVSLDGTVSTLAGAPDAGFSDGAGTAARFNSPTGVACDNSGNVYVADSKNNAVRKITYGGIVTTIAGDPTPGTVDGVGGTARFSEPGDITYDPGSSALYVVDWGSNNVRKILLGTSGP
jgi:SMP-30/Gluconolactonase/LRE-like region